MMHIGYREFTDGQTRPAYIDDDGNQYVYDGDGQPVFGIWLAPDMLDAELPVFDAGWMMGSRRSVGVVCGLVMRRSGDSAR